MASRSDVFVVSGPPREIDGEALSAIDSALARAVGAAPESVSHTFDPKRALAFEHGGPAVWSVARVSTAGPRAHHLFATCGLSELVEPGLLRRGIAHELTLRVPDTEGSSPPTWPVRVLRHLARYVLSTGRELRVGDHLPLFESIARAPMVPEHRSSQPPSQLTAVAVTRDPSLDTITTPRGTVELRRIVGLTQDELELLETWSCAGLLDLIGTRDPTLGTDLDRPSWTTERELVAEVQARSEREGSDVPAIALPGVRWSRVDAGYEVRLPGGAAGPRLARMIRARLGHGRGLLVHGPDPIPMSEVALEPSERWRAREQGRVLVVGLGADAPEVARLHERVPAHVWRLEA